LTFSTRRKKLRGLRVEMPDEEKCFFIADDIEAKRAEVKAKYPKP
jgi:HD superfamily phosphohydrolase YqeK